MAKVRDVTKEEEDWIKDNLRYNPDTGYLWWTKRVCGRPFDRPAGSVDKGHGYVFVSRKNSGVFVKYLAHRVAWFLYHGIWPKDQIDHTNNIRNDNRIINLREATQSENMGNKKIQGGGSSKYKGVIWENNAWRARIMVNYKKISLGSYKEEKEAALAYNKAALEHFGEYAKINDLTP
jgi:hypothetical protein